MEEQNVIKHSTDIYFDTDVDSENPRKIGKIHFTLINRSRMMNGMDGDSHDSLFESCDAISHELMMMYSILFDEEGEPKDPSLEECLRTPFFYVAVPVPSVNSGITEGDIMYLDSIEIEPSFRGYGIGLLAFDGLRGIFPSFEMDVILLNPAGLTSELEKTRGMTVWAPAQSDFKLMGMWTGLRLPRIEEVVPHLFE
ncbi:hypothetical protein B0H10DRAFT_1949339 [Mycena sp. CBHHK59/15]|nr:hypothetical protein B0H10DRAFT_1949339 [Mycena sp. CBHHK59/15]